MPDVHVYLLRIQETNYFKAGISTDVERRLSELHTGTPYLIEVVETYTQDNARETEQQIHRLLADMHVRREWFEGDPAEILRLFRIGVTMGIVDTVTDDVEPVAARVERVAVPSPPTTLARITTLLITRGQWLTAPEVAEALGIGLQHARTELSKLARYGDVIRRPCADHEKRANYEYGIPRWTEAEVEEATE